MEISDIKKYKEDYDISPISGKRSIVLGLLEVLRNRGQIFDDFYSYISGYPDEVSEIDLGQVFGVILEAIYHDSQEKVIEAATRLQGVKDTIQKMKDREKEEKSNEHLDETLTLQFSII